MSDKKTTALDITTTGAGTDRAPRYGGFWIRFLAYSADASIISFVLVAAAVPAAFLGAAGVVTYAAIIALGPFLYFAVMQASKRQATLGKELLGLKVVHAGARTRISLLRSFGRELAKVVSAALLGLGFVIAAFTRRKQGLHDLIASTEVVREESARVLAAIVVTVVGIVIPVFAVPLMLGTFLGGMMLALVGPLMGELSQSSMPQLTQAEPKPQTKAPGADASPQYSAAAGTEPPTRQRAESVSVAAAKAPAAGVSAISEPGPQTAAESALVIARAEEQLARQIEEYSKRPRRTFVGTRSSDTRYAPYIEDWRQKIERTANLDNLENPRSGISGSLRLTVSINADGTLAGTDLERSSGHKALDAAAERIVRRAAPYAKFPPDIRRDTDILVITRTWRFTAGEKVFSD
jgi:TonB family protein